MSLRGFSIRIDVIWRTKYTINLDGKSDFKIFHDAGIFCSVDRDLSYRRQISPRNRVPNTEEKPSRPNLRY